MVTGGALGIWVIKGQRARDYPENLFGFKQAHRLSCTGVVLMLRESNILSLRGDLQFYVEPYP